jgi:hypothetical protein
LERSLQDLASSRLETAKRATLVGPSSHFTRVAYRSLRRRTTCLHLHTALLHTHPSLQSSCVSRTGQTRHSQLLHIHSPIPASRPAIHRLGFILDTLLHTAIWTQLPASDRAFSTTEHTFQSIVVALYPTTRTAQKSVERRRVGIKRQKADLFV